MSHELLDCLGRRRSPAATSVFHAGRTPSNAGLRYPADPPPVEEIVAVMRAAGPGPYGARLRGIIVVLWRAGLRIGEALALPEADLDPSRGALLIRCAKGGKRREVGMDDWGWRQLEPWLEYRRQLPVGPLFCVLHGPSRGRPWAPAAVRRELRRAGVRAGVRRRLAPHQLRHAHAVELAHEGVPLVVIQRQLGHYVGDPSSADQARSVSGRRSPAHNAESMRVIGLRVTRDHPHIQHAHLGITSIYLQGIDNAEIIDTVHHRPAPVISASAGLRAP